MDEQEYLDRLLAGEAVEAGSEMHLMMHGMSQEAIRICMDINGTYHTPDELKRLMEKLTGRPIPEGFALFPPFNTDCGRNIHFGEGVFVNSGCKFQDQGGIFIGDRCLIGHNVVIATLNHHMDPAHRGAWCRNQCGWATMCGWARAPSCFRASPWATALSWPPGPWSPGTWNHVLWSAATLPVSSSESGTSCCAPIGCLRRRCATWAAGPRRRCADGPNYSAPGRRGGRRPGTSPCARRAAARRRRPG